VPRASLFVNICPVCTLFLALSRDSGDDGAFQDIREHEAKMPVRRTDASRRVGRRQGLVSDDAASAIVSGESGLDVHAKRLAIDP
jgi:hypothetical protein